LIEKYYPSFQDDVINAITFNKKYRTPGVSEEIKCKFISDTYEKVKNININRITEWRNLKNIALISLSSLIINIYLLILCPKYCQSLISQFLRPSTNIYKIEILPGDAKIPTGSKIVITAKIKGYNVFRYIPSLIYKYSSDKVWRKKYMSVSYYNQAQQHLYDKVSEKEVKFAISINEIFEDLYYYVKFANTASKIYKIKVISPPLVENMELTYKYPEYVGKKTEVVKTTDGNIETLYGTTINVKIKSNKSLNECKFLFSDGEIHNCKVYKNTSVGEIYVLRDRKYTIELLDADGYKNLEMPTWEIKVIPDNYPQVKLLSPTENIIASELSKVNVVYEAEDDYGISVVNLIVRNVNKNTESIFKVKEFPTYGKKKVLDEYEFRVNKISPLAPGDVLECVIEVCDTDTISGPKKSYSEKFFVEIFSFEKEHQRVLDEMSAFKDNLSHILSDQIDIAEKTKELYEIQNTTNAAIVSSALDNIYREQNKIFNNTQNAINNLSKILDKMYNDPLMDTRIIRESEGIRDNLQYLLDKPMKNVFSEISNKNLGNLIKNQDEIISVLERMTLISEDISQYQQMKDLLTKGQEATSLCKDMIDTLRNTPEINKDKINEIQNLLSKINNLINNIANILSTSGKILPEEFVNQRALKELNFNTIENTIDKINKKLSSGNISNIVSDLENLLKSLEDMLATLQNAAYESTYSNLNKINDKLKNHISELDDIIKNQEELMSETSPLAAQQKKYQEANEIKLLEELIKKQNTAIKLIENSRNKVSEITYPIPPQPETLFVLRENINHVLPKMHNVLDELKNKSIKQTPLLLKDVIEKLEEQITIINNISISIDNIKNDTVASYNIEKEILKLLMETSPAGSCFGETLDKNEKNLLMALSEKQQKIRGRTKKLVDEIKDYASETSIITGDIFENFKAAAENMDEASNNLSSIKPLEAYNDEADALYYLSQNYEKLQSLYDELSKENMQYQPGSASPMPFIILKSRPAGGSSSHGLYGFETRYVPLPKKDEFMPAEEIKRELLEGMKDSYPKIYQNKIKEYYRKIIE
jgi:ABC-type transporter Mla subunit MlaD